MTLAANHDPAEFIVNAEKVCAVFGKWPTFHDSEVLTVALDRGTLPNFQASTVIRVRTCQVHRDETNSKGYYMTTDQVMFEGIHGIHAAFHCQKVTGEAVEAA